MAWLAEKSVALIFYGPRERALGVPGDIEALPVVFRSGEVTLYATEHIR